MDKSPSLTAVEIKTILSQAHEFGWAVTISKGWEVTTVSFSKRQDGQDAVREIDMLDLKK